jgi:hypothetical protein
MGRVVGFRVRELPVNKRGGGCDALQIVLVEPDSVHGRDQHSFLRVEESGKAWGFVIPETACLHELRLCGIFHSRS